MTGKQGGISPPIALLSVFSVMIAHDISAVATFLSWEGDLIGTQVNFKIAFKPKCLNVWLILSKTFCNEMPWMFLVDIPCKYKVQRCLSS